MFFGAHRTEHKVNHDQANLPTAILATGASFIASLGVVMPQVPEWITRGILPFVLGVGVFTVNKFVGKWIDRRWPDRRKGDTNP